jgi:hypothetical protein
VWWLLLQHLPHEGCWLPCLHLLLLLLPWGCWLPWLLLLAVLGIHRPTDLRP